MAPTGLYGAFRQYGLPAYYTENKTAVTADVVLAGLVCAFFILALSFIAVIPGIRNRERFTYIVRIGISLYIGAAILIANFGQEWEVAEIKTQAQYKAFISEEIKATIGVKIGLRSVNVTLKGDPVNQVGERIDYNERFSWTWDQGRLGFGPFAGVLSREFREAQWKGLPYPILWIVEYFTLDGENIRWGRSYRTAGFFTHVCLWTSFPLWLLTNILFCLLIRYGVYLLFLNGSVMLLSNIIYAYLRWGPDLKIPFKDGVIEFHYGWCFWITMATGLICIALASLILLLDYFFPVGVATFFGHDIIENYEDVFIEETRHETPNEDNVSFHDNSPGAYRDEQGLRYENIELDVSRRKGIATKMPPSVPTLPYRKGPGRQMTSSGPPKLPPRNSTGGDVYHEEEDIYEYVPALRPKAGHRNVRKPKPTIRSVPAKPRVQRDVRFQPAIQEEDGYDDDDDDDNYANIPLRKPPPIPEHRGRHHGFDNRGMV